jgi:RNA polymerase sigma-70 factor (ECF subfamily)
LAANNSDIPSDQELIASFRNDRTKTAAFTALVKKYQERLYWHIRRMVIDHTDTDDILQNVFVKVWRYLESFREDANLYTWLYRIATNETLNWLEVQKRFKSVSMSGQDDYYENKLIAQRDYDPSKIEWQLQKAIAQLPEKQKLVFNLRYYDEMPYDEMSAVLGTSEGALKASYHHAVKKVEECLLNR